MSRNLRGIGAAEVLVGIALVGAASLVLMMVVPKGREAARQAGCRRNLMQIGQALSLYHQWAGQLPTARLGGPSPLAAILGELGVADLRGVSALKEPGPVRGPAPRVEYPVPGFICPSDPVGMNGGFPAPVSYRGVAGSTVEGRDGPFGLDRRLTLPEVEAADGAAFTLAFAERRIGPGAGRPGDPGGYVLVGRPGVTSAADFPWRGDAGYSWLSSDWRSTLLNNSLTPDASGSWIAEDGRTAAMGASAAHPSGVHVLLLDGSVTSYRAGVDRSVWKALATTGSPRE